MLHTHIVLQKRIHISALISSSLLLVLSILAFFPVASSFSDTLAAPVQSETTLSMTAENINLDLSVDNPNGTFNASDPASLTVATNNYTGYTLSILASTSGNDATKLVNGEDSITSISTASSANDFNNGNWGILPSKVNSAANSSYIPAPTTEGTTLDATNSANADANSYTIALGAKADYTLPAGKYSNTFVITAVANPVGYSISYSKNTEDEVSNMPASQTGDLGDTDVTVSANIPTRIGYTFNNWCDDTVTSTNGVDACSGNVYEPGDIFATSMQTTNSLTLVAMWNRTFTLNFDANGGTGTMSPQTITGTSANINENTFTRDGYNFAGWNTLANGTGTAYTSGAVYTVPATGTSDTLYAQWELIVESFDKAFADAGKTKITIGSNQYYKMQDMSATICAAVDEDQEAQLADSRDNKTYWVLKAKDGHCWMTQNLDHNIVTTANFYTPDNTDISTNWTPVRATTPSTNVDPSNGTINGWTLISGSLDKKTPYSFDPGNYYWTDSWYPTSECPDVGPETNPQKCNYLAENRTVEKFSTTQYGSGEHGHIGNYYNWPAAIAMNDISGSFSSDTSTNIQDNPQSSICPKGWRLPTGYGDSQTIDARNEYKYLFYNYGADDDPTGEMDRTITSAPLYFVRAGAIHSKTITNSTPSGYTRTEVLYPRGAGNWGDYMTSTVKGTTSIYYLTLKSAGYYSMNTISTGYGLSIRCVAR